MTARLLPLRNLGERHIGVTNAIGETFEEAAGVCLDRHHMSPVEVTIIDDESTITAIAEWRTLDARTRAAWNNEIDTTEAGAYGCVLAAVELARGLFAVRRADTHTGADYYIAPAGTPLDDLEDCLRLEVSGVSKGGAKVVEQRLSKKMGQAKDGDSNLPALAGVVGFEVRLILLRTVGDK